MGRAVVSNERAHIDKCSEERLAQNRWVEQVTAPGWAAFAVYQARAVLPGAEGRTGLPMTTDHQKSAYVSARQTPALCWPLQKEAIGNVVILHQAVAGTWDPWAVI